MERLINSNLTYLRSLPDYYQLEDDFMNPLVDIENVAFLCYGISTLRRVNYAYGRRVGDALLATIAQWASDSLGGKIYRIDGDLFCLVFKDTTTKDVYDYAGIFDSRFSEVWEINIDNRHFDIYAQAAIAVIGNLKEGYSLDLPDLFDRALELSKESNQITVFSAKDDRATQDRAKIQIELKRSVLSGMEGFDVHYQPLTDPLTCTWRGLEALCRWNSPSAGPIPPDVFIAEAEGMGLIHQIGTWVLNRALAACKKLSLDRIDRFFVTINISALQLTKKGFVPSVLEALEKHNYPAEKLILELTESTAFNFTDATLSTVETLRAKGIRFALDDFGSGYSGFSNLKNLPVDILKTDREFITGIEHDNYLQYFYYIMSETSHANGIQLVAEGVENHDQLKSVVKNGADLIQGYLFGKPMDSRSIEEQLHNFSNTLPEFVGWMNSLEDFNHWLDGQSAYEITPSLFRLQNSCINIILNESNTGQAVDRIFEAVGTHFKVQRVYVFLRDEGTIFSNRYEWCAEGVRSQKHLFQNVDATIDGFYDVLRENEVVMAASEVQLPNNLLERLSDANEGHSVQSIVVMPMKQRDEIIGFVGFDDSASRNWMLEELIILHTLCLLCLIIIAEKRSDR